MANALLGLLTILLIVALAGLVLKHRQKLQLESEHELLRTKYEEIYRKFGSIIDVDSEVEKIRQTLAALSSERDREIAANKARQKELAKEYESAKSIYDRLRAEVSLLEENLEDISFGLYKPHFDYQTSEEFKVQLEANKDRQKSLVKDGKAAHCAVEWTVGNSRREGERMQKQYTKLLLRAFNGECDAAAARVAWNNIIRMEERVQKAFSAINELGGVMKVSVTRDYLALKIAELRLQYEYEEKRRQEIEERREEQRRIKEQMREEERVQRELEKAEIDARAEEERFSKALEKARIEVAKAKGEEHQRLNKKVLELEAELEAARRKKERAISMAQLTRSGYVYFISNIGSFGDDVYKIGMTRRLEPMDRIRELGDASVPFAFDVHAMVYCEDAPKVEGLFHSHFHRQSVNLVNMRKEFFRIPLSELDEFARSQGLAISFTKVAEAREYRETLAIRQKDNHPRPSGGVPSGFPDALPVI